MSDWLDLKTLYAMLVRELENDSIQYVQPTIYQDIANMLGNLKGQGYDGMEAKVKNKLVQLIGDVAKLLLYTRLDKIRDSKIDYSNLTEAEQYVIASEKELRSRFEQVLSATLEGRIKALEDIALKAKTMHVLLRFLRSMEAISGIDNSRYGPFEEEDIAVLPFENAKRLIEQGIAVELPWLDQ
jgi:DNA replication factor GINS